MVLNIDLQPPKSSSFGTVVKSTESLQPLDASNNSERNTSNTVNMVTNTSLENITQQQQIPLLLSSMRQQTQEQAVHLSAGNTPEQLSIVESMPVRPDSQQPQIASRHSHRPWVEGREGFVVQPDLSQVPSLSPAPNTPLPSHPPPQLPLRSIRSSVDSSTMTLHEVIPTSAEEGMLEKLQLWLCRMR